MPTLEINGRDVEVDDSFLSMTPEQQERTVDEIAAALASGDSGTGTGTGNPSGGPGMPPAPP